MKSGKLEKLRNLMEVCQFDAVALIPSPSFRWLTGMDKHLMERPTVILVTQEQPPAIVAAGFEMGSFEKTGMEFRSFPFSDNPSLWEESFQLAGQSLNLAGKKIAVEPNHFRFLEMQFLQNAIEGCQVVSGESLFKRLRLHKTPDEIDQMKKAAQIAESALSETLKIIRTGISEHEIAAELTAWLLRKGSEPTLPFPPIVASGPNSADPHAAVSDRMLQNGDFLLFDWGASYQGYCSDLTRTFAIGEISTRQAEVYQTVLAANQAAFEAAKPGVPCGSIDLAARTEIEKAGYGAYFTHRLGHGLGLEAHEDPYMYAENQQILEEGMVFTDEPGIYLAGEFGVRIEDDLTITAQGCERMTNFPRDLRTL